MLFVNINIKGLNKHAALSRQFLIVITDKTELLNKLQKHKSVKATFFFLCFCKDMSYLLSCLRRCPSMLILNTKEKTGAKQKKV